MPVEDKPEKVTKVINTSENFNHYTITDILGLGKLFESANFFWLSLFTLIAIGWTLGKC